ncbi:MAG: EpsG family protein [Lachnospiraceae bacterium]|nr:EpsG family protein [Lachnospiraceae bacterium]
MIFYTLLTAAVIGLSLFVNNHVEAPAYGVSRRQALNGLALFSSFLLLFTVAALRMNVGNDYAKYCEFFHLIRCKLDTPTTVPTEAGFNAVCILIYLLCGRQELYPVMFAFFALVTLLLFYKGMYRLSDCFPLTFFLFMTLGYYFQSFSTVRYYFALSIALFSIRYVIEKQWAKFVLLILFGAFFHKSLLLVLPMYLLSQLSLTWWMYALAGAAFISCPLFSDFYMSVFLKLYPTYEATEYLEGGTSYISILRCAAVFVFSLFFYRKHIKQDRTLNFYFNCNLMGLMIYTCCFFLPVISRIGYYLSITHILFVPALILKIEDAKYRKAVTGLVLLSGLVYFGVFILYKASGPGLSILPYRTFLYHKMVTILSEVSP